MLAVNVADQIEAFTETTATIAKIVQNHLNNSDFNFYVIGNVNIPSWDSSYDVVSGQLVLLPYGLPVLIILMYNQQNITLLIFELYGEEQVGPVGSLFLRGKLIFPPSKNGVYVSLY